ncbi:hypothetical protein B0H63DRAFT_98380 [Podospora didyma]|uniref:Uncharacterized protein n=1 Tax=Podospora didyma TaxID=330526 RepID=A0AAE0U3L6_9PEZI|nr:hypothetical protein B0H63DRAFT_98380 [Podospora didyma]
MILRNWNFFALLAALQLPALGLAQHREFYKWNSPRAVANAGRHDDGIFGRQTPPGYHPEFGTCGSGTTCENACGSNWQSCNASTNLSLFCYNQKELGQTCCENGSGRACDPGYYCAWNEIGGKVWCCENGQSLEECGVITSSSSASGSSTRSSMISSTKISTTSSPTGPSGSSSTPTGPSSSGPSSSEPPSTASSTPSGTDSTTSSSTGPACSATASYCSSVSLVTVTTTTTTTTSIFEATSTLTVYVDSPPRTVTAFSTISIFITVPIPEGGCSSTTSPSSPSPPPPVSSSTPSPPSPPPSSTAPTLPPTPEPPCPDSTTFLVPPPSPPPPTHTPDHTVGPPGVVYTTKIRTITTTTTCPPDVPNLKLVANPTAPADLLPGPVLPEMTSGAQVVEAGGVGLALVAFVMLMI